MKKRYERRDGIIILCIALFLFEFLFFGYLINKKITLYKNFSGVVFKNDLLVVLLNDDDLKLFYKNKNIYIKNNKKSFLISKVLEDVLERDNVSYNQVFIEVDISNDYKENDVIDVSIMEKRVSSINIFRIIWEGD